MTDIEQVVSSQAIQVITQGTDEAFAEWAVDMDAEELGDVGLVLSRMSKTSAVRAGWTAYQIRLRTPDGEWKQKVWELATAWEVSDRTIHRWMAAAQAHFGLELTPAQKNAAASPRAAEPEEEGDPGPDWGDDEDPFAGLDLEGDNLDDGEGGSLLDRMNAEAGWGDDTLPSADYESPPERQASVPRPPAVEPDPTWVAFTMAQLQADHDNVYSDEAARRMATSRWQGRLDRDPLELLEELEMIYEVDGSSVPDSIVEALHKAEDDKPIKPDEVTEPKRPKGKLAYGQAEKLLVSVRQLHEYCHAGLKNGTVPDREVAAMLPHLESVPHGVAGLREMAKKARDRVLTEEGGTAASRIDATLEAEAQSEAFEA